MANFELMDDDYGDMFITQVPRSEKVVSLEEDGGFKTVRCEEYSDISDFEDDGIERQLR